MSTDLFGKELIGEESFEIIYTGNSFGEGKILVKSLYVELQALDNLLTASVNLLIQNKKLDPTCRDFQIYIQIEKGSVFEKVKVIFKNAGTVAVIGTYIIPFLNTTYSHFLNNRQTDSGNKFYQEIKTIEGDASFKNNLKNILSPLGNGDNILINNGSVTININNNQKDEITRNLDHEVTNPELINGTFEEDLVGVIRKIDLDASHSNYFGFNVEHGDSRISTSVRGEFNLINYKEIINEPIKIHGMIKYKDGKMIHVEILEYQLLNKKEKLAF